MIRLGTVAAAIAAVMLLAQGAAAAGRRHHVDSRQKVDPRVDVVGLGVGVASTVGYFALTGWRLKGGTSTTGLTPAGALVATTAGCIVASPLVATAVVRRPLTHREAHVLMVGCVIPFVGPWLVNAAYDAHPEWAAFDGPVATQPPPRRSRR